MKAEDTEIKDYVNYRNRDGTGFIQVPELVKAQAAISFKAGQDSVFGSIPENLPPLLETAHRAGIKEVVEWVESHSHKMNTNMYGISLERAEWQAQLKEWGIK